MTEAAERTLVQTEGGACRGLCIDGIVQFRGVPFASIERRFQRSEAVTPWAGVLDATRHGPIASQAGQRLERVMGSFSRAQSEDCLSLTISTPGVGSATRPVMVFLHGGAYLSGAGSLDWYDGATISRDGGVVFVGINYRLGALGFLHHPALNDVSGGDATSPGLDDICRALLWIQRNVRAFGGDPDAVTVLGQSAGAHAIMMMLASGRAAGLFHRAVLQSAPAGLMPHTTRAAKRIAELFVGLLGLDAQGAAESLRSSMAIMPVERLVDAQMRLGRETAQFGEIAPPFLPVSDAFADRNGFIRAIAKNACALGIDLIIGTTAEESHAFFAQDVGSPEPSPLDIAALFKRYEGTEDAIERFRAQRSGASATDLVSDLKTAHDFALPSYELASAVRTAGARVWVYRFDWRAPGSPFKACHCLELPFLFGTWAAWADAPMLEGGDRREMEALGHLMRQCWIRFAQGDSPASDRLQWPEFDDSERVILRFAERVGLFGDCSRGSTVTAAAG